MVPKILKWTVSVLVLAVVGLSIPAVRHLREVPPPPPPPLTLTLGAPPGTELGSGDEPLDAAISPDERQIVFVANRSGTTMLWRRMLDSDRAEPLAGTEGARLPAWSSSGDAILFFTSTHLRRLAIADGAIGDIADAGSPAGAASLPDGSILFAPQATGAIRRLQGQTVTDATTLRAGDRAHAFPFSTNRAGDFVYTAIADTGRRTVRLVHDGEEHELGATSGHGQIVGGVLLVVRDDVLLAQRVDLNTGVFQGRTTTLISGVGVAAGRSLFAASSRIVLSAPSATRARELAWFDVNGTRTGTMGEAGDLWQVRLSPDDQFAAVTHVAPLLRTLDITVVPAAAGAASEPLTLALAADSDPVWSPDGRRVAFRSLQSGRPAIYAKRAHDKDAEDVAIAEGDAAPTDWRGPNVLVHALESGSGRDINAIDDVRHTKTTLVKSGFNDTDGRWSPDGTWLVYVSDESGRPDIYANRRERSRVRVSFAGGTKPRWSRDGQSIFFLRGSTIMRAMLLTNNSPASFAPAAPVLDAPGIRDFDVAHRGDALVAIVPVNSSSSATVSAIVDWQSRLYENQSTIVSR